MRQLAYVGEDGQVRVADLDADREIKIAGHDGPEADHGAVCNWPTWSPSGDRLAFFRYDLAGEDVQHASVCLAPADGSSSEEIYGLPAGAPIYMGWSPDGERLAVLVQ
jgi:Tol biopolymer transport system component